ncbi:hypothetical protein PsorP6_007822 [Peronosclerospora sorghi]|uniref:Uncharacterized protein n=1 Tax=Peronosclerospora sorghi TaxID=230839 RepID=A0ACC0W6X1_9STRA|nr:hypothetical protein PsorP6_007822 [Peronosclerospora sorghi]
MKKPHVVVVMASACCIATSVLAAMESIDPAARKLDPSTRNEQRNEREDLTTGSDDERMAPPEINVNALLSSGKQDAMLVPLTATHTVPQYELDMSRLMVHPDVLRVSTKFQIKKEQIGPSVRYLHDRTKCFELNPVHCALMALGDAYFRRLTVNEDVKPLEAMPPADPAQENELGKVLEKRAIDPTRALSRFRWLVATNKDPELKSQTFGLMALGNELFRRLRLFEAIHNLSLDPLRVEYWMDLARQAPKNGHDTEDALLEKAITMALGEHLTLKSNTGADFV